MKLKISGKKRSIIIFLDMTLKIHSNKLNRNYKGIICPFALWTPCKSNLKDVILKDKLEQMLGHFDVAWTYKPNI